jgi:molybdopterin-guanine dinucleotide biosynthesis protein A
MALIPLPLVIVAGGKSSRMGSDKALLPFGTFPTLVQYQLNRLKPFFQSVHVSAKSRAKFHFDASFIEDTASYQEHSPLVALLSILQSFQTPVCVLSVDTPFVSPEVFETLYANLDGGTDAVIATSASSSHQLCAIYSPTVIPVIQTMLEKNEHKIRLVLEHINTVFVTFEDDTLFFNVNHPHEYELAKERL